MGTKPSEIASEIDALQKLPPKKLLQISVVVVIVAASSLAWEWAAQKAKQAAAPSPTASAPTVVQSNLSVPLPELRPENRGGSEERPDIKRVYPVDIVGAPARGPLDAPLTIVEFMDFEGPHCKEASDLLLRLESELPGKIRRIYKGDPLTVHTHSRQVARAALAADAVGHFWPLHDALFRNQGQLDSTSVEAMAVDVGIRRTDFLEQLARVDDAKIEGDVAQARQLGITAVPTIFINGHKLTGVYPFAFYEKVANEILTHSL